MKELSPEARAIIEATRLADEPTSADKERIRKAVYAEINKTPNTSSGNGSAGLTGRWLMKSIWMSVILVVAWVVWMSFSNMQEQKLSSKQSVKITPSSKPPPTVVQDIPRLTMTHVQSKPEKHPQKSADFKASSLIKPSAKTTRPRSKKNKRASQVPHRVKLPNRAQPKSLLEKELRLLRAAQLARKQGELDQALNFLSEHNKRFPDGILASERDAARVLTLCDAKQVDSAKIHAEHFLKNYPNSPLGASVRASCVFIDSGD